jgi:two-component system, cell cycle sensor histidine kinase and response regulator CckA
MLTPMMGYAGMIADSIDRGHPLAKPAQEILGAAERARDLVAQLLAFGRVQVLRVRSVSLNDVISRLLKLLRRTLRDDIELAVSLADQLPLVLADPSQVEQVLMNLAVNAQDAMPDGGRLTIATEVVETSILPPAEARGLPQDRTVCMSVGDDGVGMDPATRDRAFEPFFTTKGQGKGNGLGLATVYGIVRQHGGQVLLDTASGAGTTARRSGNWPRRSCGVSATRCWWLAGRRKPSTWRPPIRPRSTCC